MSRRRRTRSFPPHLRGSGNSRTTESWSLHGSNAVDVGQARLVVINDPEGGYLESKPIQTVINDKLSMREKNDEQIQTRLCNLCNRCGVHV